MKSLGYTLMSENKELYFIPSFKENKSKWIQANGKSEAPNIQHSTK